MPTSPRYSTPEIERRWLVFTTSTPHEAPDRERWIEDRCVSGTRLRLRKIIESNQVPIYKLGKKYESAELGTHQVVSTYLSEDEYKVLTQLPARVAKKRRLSVNGGSLDIYSFPEIGFHVYKIEFKTSEDAAVYEPPNGVGKEITNEAKYSGFALARSEA